MNLIEELQEELSRNRELLKKYESIPQGVFGATVIKQAIKNAKTAMANNDTVAMLKCYKELQETS